jgi:hypothetical protein
MRSLLAITGFLALAACATACAPNGMSASSSTASEVRIAQEQDALPGSCQTRGTIPVERRETLKRRILATGANLVRYPVQNEVLPIYRCSDADIQKFFVWNGG